MTMSPSAISRAAFQLNTNLRKFLTRKLVTSLRQLMDRIDKDKRVEEDQQLGKGQAKVVPGERRDFR